jgi:amidohydrolase
MTENLISLRKELHRYPELSGNEKATAARIVKELETCNPDEIIEGVGGSGVIAKFSSGSGRAETSILFRAELDAIAVDEETGLDHQSKQKGVMHGCGHDGHMAILIGLAYHLKQKKYENLDIYLLFQPSEETGEGAGRVLADDRFQNLQINHAFALHNLPGFKENSVQIKEGVFAAASVGVDLKFKGRSSHAAYPEQGLNPSACIAEFIMLVNQKLEGFRDKNPLNKAVNTYIRLGEPAFGINPGTGELGFTLRSPSDDDLDDAVQLVHETGKLMGNKFEGSVEIKTVEPFAATINSGEGVQLAKEAAQLEGIDVEELNEPFPWSEDFGEFRKKCPITIFGLGAGEKSASLHSEKYDFNDALIPVGVRLFKKIAELCAARQNNPE